jgi:hypothetical protein
MKIRGMMANNGKVWIAMSLEFGLAAQATTEAEAKTKLTAQIQEYYDEALTLDEKFQAQLLGRKAPLSWYIRYYCLKLKELGKTDSSVFFYPSSPDSVSHA